MPKPLVEITQQFGFDAAHYLDGAGDTNRRMHGHSFYAEVTLRGTPDAKLGWVRNFEEVNSVLSAIRAELDHHLLNEIDGLKMPTLENLARYIFTRAKEKMPEVCRVKLSRPSYGQSCQYEEE
jgi:6-pyruvoyltetrahydropterin/6-carboxytetrahydropterin synthase